MSCLGGKGNWRRGGGGPNAHAGELVREKGKRKKERRDFCILSSISTRSALSLPRSQARPPLFFLPPTLRRRRGRGTVPFFFFLLYTTLLLSPPPPLAASICAGVRAVGQCDSCSGSCSFAGSSPPKFVFGGEGRGWGTRDRRWGNKFTVHTVHVSDGLPFSATPRV